VLEVTGRFGAAPAAGGFFGGTFSLDGVELIEGFFSCIETMSAAEDSAKGVSNVGFVLVACSSAMINSHVQHG